VLCQSIAQTSFSQTIKNTLTTLRNISLKYVIYTLSNHLLILLLLLCSSITQAQVDISGDYRLHSGWFPETSFLNRGTVRNTSDTDWVPGTQANLTRLDSDWDSEKWKIHSTGDGYYFIQNFWGAETGYLTRAGVRNSDNSGWEPGDSVHFYKFENWTSQKWKITPVGDGRYQLQNAWDEDSGYLSRLGVSDGNGGTIPSPELKLYSMQEWESQKWSLLQFNVDCSWQQPVAGEWVSNYTLVAQSGSYKQRSFPNVTCEIDKQILANQSVKVVAERGEWLYVQNQVTGQWGWVEKQIFDSSNVMSATSRLFDITAKSYIAPIGDDRVGILPGTGRNPNTFENRLRYELLHTLVGATDSQFSENPTTANEDKAYRIFSNMFLQVSCIDQRLVSLKKLLTSDTGKEGPFQAPPGIEREEFKRISERFMSFTWYVRAKPHETVEPVFQTILPRENPYIWHRVAGYASCLSYQPKIVITSFRGSAFPSHRYWIDGKRQETKKQGGIANLWSLDVPSL